MAQILATCLEIYFRFDIMRGRNPKEAITYEGKIFSRNNFGDVAFADGLRRRR